MADTLPPGWTGNDSDHHTDIGPFRLHVYRPSAYNPFARRNLRADYYRWHISLVSPVGTGKPLSEARDSCATAPLARHAALTALLALLTTATREATEALAGLETP